jgi:hypothetical protein
MNTPIDAEDLRKRLHEGDVKFQFKKKNGDMRDAVGTTNLESVPESSHPSGDRDSSPKVVVFFDLDKGEWRSVSKDTEIYLID